jgi:hypothetical protein
LLLILALLSTANVPTDVHGLTEVLTCNRI